VTNYAAITESITVHTLAPGFTTNVATLTSLEQGAGLEPNTGNNIAIIPNTILGIVDVKINSLTASANPAVVGSSFNYTINVGNKGQYVASSITVTDTLPAQLSYISGWITNGTQVSQCYTDFYTGVLTCPIANLTNGAAATIVVSVLPTAPGTVINMFGAIPFDYDLNLANNFSNIVTTIASASVQIISPRLSGTNFTFSFLTMSNQSYTIQVSTNLASSTNWNLYSNFIGNGSNFQLRVPVKPGPRQFFRVREP